MAIISDKKSLGADFAIARLPFHLHAAAEPIPKRAHHEPCRTAAEADRADVGPPEVMLTFESPNGVVKEH